MTEEEKQEIKQSKQRKKKTSENKQKHQGEVSQIEKKSNKQQKNKGGRPKGSKNKNKTEVELNPELLRIKGWIRALLKQLGAMLPVTYLLRFRSLWE